MAAPNIDFDKIKAEATKKEKFKGGDDANGEMRVSAKPDSLLDPKECYVDHDLPKQYLAHCIGIETLDLVTPVTMTVGWKRFPYFDPPAQKKGSEPHRVGEFPCVVFETTSANGQRQHAERIYIAPGGQGFAELGKRTTGKPRNPQKTSTKEHAGKDIGGLAVWWGNRAKATRLYLCQEIETGQAIANALKREIESGRSTVAAVTSAHNIEKLCPNDTSNEVIVAANDSTVAETAARAFAFHNHKRVKVRIAIPGDPADGNSFLDLFRTKGAAAVIDRLKNGQLFRPTQREIDEHRKRQKKADDIDRAMQAYPLPDIEAIPLELRHSTKDGKVKIYLIVDWEMDPETNEIKGPKAWKVVSSLFSISHRIRYLDKEDAYGLRVHVEDMNGKPRAVDFPRSKLAKIGGADIREALFAAGLCVYPDGIHTVSQICQAAAPSREILVVSLPGWHKGSRETPFYVSPGREVISCADVDDIELIAGAGINGARAGTLEGQLDALKGLLRVPNCPHWHLGAAAGGVGVLLDLIEDDSCGLCLSGNTSVGKTLAQKLAASWWGGPMLGDGMLRSMKATSNALEGIAQLANGSVLTLDELAHAEDRQVASMVYMIAGNEGKKRLSKDMDIRPGFRWRTFALLSSEHDIKKRVEDSGASWMGGMSVRMPSVKVSGVNVHVPVHALQVAETGLRVNFGHIGPAFVKALIANGLHLEAQLLKEQINRLAVELASGKQGSTPRAARPFALLSVAGSLAKGWGVLPEDLDIESAVQWSWETFLDSDEALALSPEDRAIGALRQWIVERWDVTVKPLRPKADNYGKIIDNNREALAWYDDNCIYLPKGRLVEASGKTMTETGLAKKLDDMGAIANRHSGRRYMRAIPGHSSIDAYALKVEMFGRTDTPHLHDTDEDDSQFRNEDAA